MKKTVKSITGKFMAGAIAASFSAFAGFASASSINLATGFSSAGSFSDAATYQSVVESAVATPTIGYGQTALSVYDGVTNQGLFGSNNNIAFDFTVNFAVTAANAGLWELRLGTDFGRGGAVFLDGIALGFRSNDMWWAGSYSDPSQYFDFNAMLGIGDHVLNVYGLEGCCDGAHQGQFKAANSNGFVTFSNDDGLNHAVPEPTTIALLGLGLFGFCLTRRRKQ